MSKQYPHIGIIVPANNTTMEPEIARATGYRAIVTPARVTRGEGLLKGGDLTSYKKNAHVAAEALAGTCPDVVFYGCTAAGLLSGPEKDAAFTAELKALFKVPVVSTARAMVDILKREGVAKVDVISPYHAEVNEALRAFLANDGIEACRIASLEAEDVHALGRLTAEDVFAVASRARTPGAQAVFIACSQLPTFDILPALRREQGVPVWSSIAATAELGLAALAAAG